MSIHVALRHVTQYKYDRAVELSPQLVRLRPAPHCRTPILSYSQRITPSGHFLNWMQDPQSNYVARVTFAEKVEAFRVEINLVAEMAVYNPFDFFLEPSAEHVPFSYNTSECASCSRFCTPRRSRRVWPATSKASIAGDGGPSISWSMSTASCNTTFRTSSGSIRECRRWSERSSWNQGPAATPRGCSCNCFDILGSPRVLCPAI